MPTPTIPSTGKVDMNSIQNAFPGLSNPPNLAEFIGVHPSLPATPGSSISFGQFHGLTAVSPTFSFSNVALSNGSMTASNGTLIISGSAGFSTKALAGSISLSNYLSFVHFNAPVTFALSNGSSWPTGVSLGSNGILAHALTVAVTSTAKVIVTNRWGNMASIPFAYNVAAAIGGVGQYGLGSLVSNRTASMVLTSRGNLFVMGDQSYGLLGNSYTTVTGYDTLNNLQILTSRYGSLSNLSSIGGSIVFVAMTSQSSGSGLGMAIDNTGSLHAWGANTMGVLGMGPNDVTTRYLPNKVNTTNGISSLYNKSVATVALSDHAIAIDSIGVLHAWGNNDSGQLGMGSGDVTARYVPQLVNTTTGTSSLSLKTVMNVACGLNYSVALDSLGAIHAWGLNTNGQLGTNDNGTRYVPQQVNKNSGTSSLYNKVVTSIACGDSHTVAIDSNGLLHAWGLNDHGQLGMGPTDITNRIVPQLVNASNGTSSMYGKVILTAVCGNYNTIALDTTNMLHAWGYNVWGQLGTGGGEVHVPTLVNTANGTSSLYGKTIASIACAGMHTLALDSTGALHEWGWHGTTYQGYTNNITYPTLTSLLADKASDKYFINDNGRYGVGSLAVGASGSWIVANNTVYVSQMPVVTSTDTMSGSISTLIASNGFIKYLVASYASGGAYAIDSNGALHSGSFTSWQLVTTTNGVSSLYGRTVTYVASYYMHTIVLDSLGIVHAFGNNSSGQLGIALSDKTDRTNPQFVNVTNGVSSLYNKTVKSIACGVNYTMVLDTDGNLHSWGANGDGNLGVMDNAERTVPTLVNKASGSSSLYGKTVVSVACGDYHVLALDSTGALHSWGQNSSGQVGLGNGNIYNSFATACPVDMSATSSPPSSLYNKNVVAIACGNACSFALDSTGVMHAWGTNYYGTLGMGLPFNTSLATPSLVNTTITSSLYGRTVIAFACSSLSVLALDNNNNLHSWGQNTSGQLMEGSLINRVSPGFAARPM